GASLTTFVKGKQNKPGKVFEIGDRWRDAQLDVDKIVPGPYTIGEGDKVKLTESVKRGYESFMGRGPYPTDCATCHIDCGRKAPFKFDDWGTLVKARDLPQGVYRGGRRPIDLYNRIYSGITGSGMPEHTKLAPEQIWDLVNFVRALPYPQM